MTAWIVDPERGFDEGDPPRWVEECAQRGGVGMVAFAPGGTPHTFRVESDTAKMLFLSTPAGVEDYVKGLAEPRHGPGCNRLPMGRGFLQSGSKKLKLRSP